MLDLGYANVDELNRKFEKGGNLAWSNGWGLVMAYSDGHIIRRTAARKRAERGKYGVMPEELQKAVDLVNSYMVPALLAAEYTGKNMRSIHWEIEHGYLPRVKIHGRWMIPLSCLEDLKMRPPKAYRDQEKVLRDWNGRYMEGEKVDGEGESG